MTFDATELQVATDDFTEKTPVDVFFMDNVLLFMLMNGTKFQDTLVTAGELVDGGKRIKVFLEYAGSNVSAYGPSSTIPVSKKRIIQAARFRWAGYVAANLIDLDDKVQNTGTEMVVNLAQAKLMNIQKTLRDKMGTNVYASAASNIDFLGLGDLFNVDKAIAYGGIKENDMANWKANVITTAENMNYKTMQKIRRAAAVGQAREAKPNLYITTDVLKDSFERTLQAQVRYEDKDLANAGFDTILFGKVPIVADDKQSDGTCDGLNLNHMDMKTHKDYAFTRPVWEKLSTDKPDSLLANQRYIGQLVTNHRKSHCRHTGLTEAA
jgi:hypothetical protein